MCTFITFVGILTLVTLCCIFGGLIAAGAYAIAYVIGDVIWQLVAKAAPVAGVILAVSGLILLIMNLCLCLA